MATVRWKGSAAAVAQVTTATPTAANSTAYTLTIGAGSATYTSDASATVAEITAGLVAAWNASTSPELAEVIATDSVTLVTLTARTRGKPFTVTSTGAGTITLSTTTTSTGPNDWSTAANWSGGAVPVNSDDVYIDADVSILYGLAQSAVTLTSLTIGPTFKANLGLPVVTGPRPGPALSAPVNGTFTTATTGGALANSTTYYYRVSAVNAFGETLASNETSLATGASGGTHTITVKWSEVAGATGYRVYGRDSGAQQLLAIVGPVLGWIDTGAYDPAGALPTANTTGGDYYEYRDVYLAISSTTVTINSPSSHLRINTGTNQTTVVVQQVGETATEFGGYALQWKGAHASNVVAVAAGSVGIAPVGSETATLPTLHVGGGTVWAGPGVTFTTINKTGGQLTTNSGCTTLNHWGGTGRLNAGNVTTLNVFAGTITYAGVGTITTLVIGPTAVISFGADLRGRTVTNFTIYLGGVIDDPRATVTWSNHPTRFDTFPDQAFP